MQSLKILKKKIEIVNNTYKATIFSRFVIIVMCSWNFTTPETILT